MIDVIIIILLDYILYLKEDKLETSNNISSIVDVSNNGLNDCNAMVSNVYHNAYDMLLADNNTQVS